MVGRLILALALIPILVVSTINLNSCSPVPISDDTTGGGNTDSSTSGGTTQETVTISGTITNYSSPWKPFAYKGTDYRYGSIANSGEPRPYSIQVPKNWGSATVGIFKDTNGNNRYDIGEDTIVKAVIVGPGNIIVNFEIVTLYTISGTLTGNPTAQWKVVVEIEDTFPLLTYVNAVVNTSTWTYSVKVASNKFVVRVIAFRDDNNNNVLDLNEPTVYSSIYSIINADIPNVDLNIPAINTMTLKVNVSNNIYGLKIGVIAHNYHLNILTTSTPNNSQNYEHTLTVNGANGDYINVMIYYDANNNNQVDVNTIQQNVYFKEGTLPVGFVAFSSDQTTNISVNLVPQSITGSIQFINGASGFKPVLLILMNDIVNYGSISGNSYEIKFYTLEHFGSLLVLPVMFKDDNNNSLFDGFLYGGNEKFVGWYNPGSFSGPSTNISITSSTPSTNTANFYILRTLLNISLSGTDANHFKFVDPSELFISYFTGNPPTIRNLPLQNYELFTDTNTNHNVEIPIFKDDDGDGLLGIYPYKDTTGFLKATISNQTTISVNETLRKLTVTNKIVTNGSLPPDSHAKLIGLVTNSQVTGMIGKVVPITSTNVVITSYGQLIQAPPFNGNAFFESSLIDGPDPFYSFPIATNSNGNYSVQILTNQDSVISITWYVTN